MSANDRPCKAKGKLIIIHVLAGIGMAVTFGFIFGYFVMLLWNFLMPDIFGLKEITFYQGVGLVVLSRLLLGTRGYGKHDGHAFKKCHRSQQKEDQEIRGEEEGNYGRL